MQSPISVAASSSAFACKMPSLSGGPAILAFNENVPPTLSNSERESLENLLGMALLDHGIQDQLVVQRDPSLLDHFALSNETRSWLTAVPARTLKELAQAIIDASVPYFQRAAAPAF